MSVAGRPSPALHVVAGVLVDAAGRVLLAQRPAGKHLAGAWEFPGGKLEAGESPAQGLVRELREELGIEIEPASLEPLHRVPWRYGDTSLLLDAWRVGAWRGEPHPREDQAIRWQLPGEVDAGTLAPADRPILAALRLPTTYPISAGTGSGDVDRALAALQAQLGQGHTLLQLRQPQWTPAATRELARRLLPALQRHDATLLLNGDVEGALQLGPHVGVHLRAAQLRDLERRPLPWWQWVGASCHDADELARAQAIGVDFAVLGPVAATASHPGSPPLGWDRFAALACPCALPIYALGGLDMTDLTQAHAAGAQGIAAIRAFA